VLADGVEIAGSKNLEHVTGRIPAR
jgi:hypothetical protein